MVSGGMKRAMLGVMVLAARWAVPPATARPGLTGVEVIVVDPDATAYGTFQSHNQKIISSRYGIFMVHLRSRNPSYTAQQWRLSRSPDGGRTFVRLFEATHATNPAVLETDAAGNLYAARPDFADGNAYLYRFTPADGFRRPAVHRIPAAAAGKFAMAYDAARRQLYYFSQRGSLHVVGLDGQVRFVVSLLRPGEHAYLMYPLLSLARDGVLYAGWTTQKHGVYLYWDIHVMRSPDGGRTWQRLDGQSLSVPFPADDTGPAQRITLDDEFASHTWLSNMMALDGKLHLAYLAQTAPPREHYVRYDLSTGRQDHRIQPAFRGSHISLRNLDGFFAAPAAGEGGPLYYVSRNAEDSRIACLASDDNGSTWYDYAVSDEPRTPYAIGGCRAITAEGYIIGSFTERRPDDASEKMHPARVCFLRIRAGLAAASVRRARYEAGRVHLRFADVRGRPTQIRLGAGSGRWGAWRRFEATLAVTSDRRPERFQLKSGGGAVSGPYPIPWP